MPLAESPLSGGLPVANISAAYFFFDGLGQRLDSANVVHVADVQDVEDVLHVDKHGLHREVHAQVHLGPEPLDQPAPLALSAPNYAWRVVLV